MTVTWRKASRSDTTNCVELSNVGTMRDSKNPTGPTLAADLHILLVAVRSGRFDR